jgi:chromate transporter
MIYLKLYYEFFKIGLFAVGGGMATIPFLRHLSEATGWFPLSFITEMVAISESTPGPIGINMATYVGYNVAGILGGVMATLGEVTPSIIIVAIVSKSMEKFSQSKSLEHVFLGLRPAVTGLIAAAGFDIMKLSVLRLYNYAETKILTDLIDIKKAIFFILIFTLIKKVDKHPVFYIAISAAVGIAFGFAG